MRKLVTFGAFGVAAAAVAAATVLASGPGSVVDARNVASTSTGWRITATPDANAGLYGLSVVSNNDAWAVGFQSVKGTSLPLIRHWNGKSWTKVTALTTQGLYLVSVSASSASNVWITGVRNPGPGTVRFYLLHWDGHHWSTQVSATPKNSVFYGAGGVLAIGPKDVWRFFSLETSPTYTGDVTHFDGRSWTKVKVPVPIADTSVVSGNDIWATASTCTGVGCGSIVHWTGKTWLTSPQPPTTGNSTKYDGSIYQGIVARSAKDVWVIGIANPKATPGFKDIFLHWDGKSWAMLPVPADNPQWRGLTDDGAGGFWAFSLPKQSLYHYQAGAWTQIAQPVKTGLTTQLQAMAHIPGTTSVWGVGGLINSRQIDKSDVIFKYGR